MKQAGWRKWIYARYYQRVMARHEEFLAERKQWLFRDLPDRVLEIGPGIGANLPYLPRRCRWTGIEPNPYMRARLGKAVGPDSSTREIQDGQADRLDLDDSSIEAVICTLVLCSVPQPERALSEIHRVLKPGGRLFFLEHVAAPHGTWLRYHQRLVRPLWRFIADGCRADRDTEELIQQAGFAIGDIDRFRLPRHVVPPLVSPHIMGIAEKAGSGRSVH